MSWTSSTMGPKQARTSPLVAFSMSLSRAWRRPSMTEALSSPALPVTTPTLRSRAFRDLAAPFGGQFLSAGFSAFQPPQASKCNSRRVSEVLRFWDLHGRLFLARRLVYYQLGERVDIAGSLA